jgi:diguanylate cyclase (GGDEF)-like protein/PAS domain S-box-containing protein
MTPFSPPSPSLEAPIRTQQRPRLPVAAVAGTGAAAFLLWQRFGGASDVVRDLASEAIFIPLLTALAALFLLAARREGARPPMRRALRLLGAASLAVVAGNVVTLFHVMNLGRVPSGSLANLFFVAWYPLTLAAFLSIPVGRRPMNRFKLLCDAGMVLSGAGVALWYFLLRPLAGGTAAPDAIALALLYPLADLAVLVGVTTIVLRHPLDDHRGAITWLFVGYALAVLADLVFNLVALVGGGRSLLATDALYLATYLSLLVGAELFLRSPVTVARPSGQHSRLSRAASALPFVAAGATYVLLCVIALRAWVAPLSGVALGAAAVSVFFGARQLLSHRQHAARLAEEAVHASEARFRSLVQHSSDLIFVVDADGVIQFASSSVSRFIGQPADALVGLELAALVHPDDIEVVRTFLHVASGLPAVSPPAEWRLRGADDTIVRVEGIASNRLTDEAVRGIVVNARDVGERKALLDQLAHQAFHDPLTGLANRALFYDRVSHALQLSQREGRSVTVLYLDLDGFKQVNDTLGHTEGDHLLRMIANRLRACARTTDTVSRLGGDEFAVLVEDTSVARSTDRLIERIRDQMAFPFTLAGREVCISASIGSASTIGGAVDDVLRHADVAMYAAKRAEKGSHRAFEKAML